MPVTSGSPRRDRELGGAEGCACSNSTGPRDRGSSTGLLASPKVLAVAPPAQLCACTWRGAAGGRAECVPRALPPGSPPLRPVGGSGHRRWVAGPPCSGRSARPPTTCALSAERGPQLYHPPCGSSRPPARLLRLRVQRWCGTATALCCGANVGSRKGRLPRRALIVPVGCGGARAVGDGGVEAVVAAIGTWLG